MSGKAFNLSLVTWKQQEDRRWFGAKIPAASKSVELVAVGTAADHRLWTVSRRTSEDDIRPASPSPNYRATELLAQRNVRPSCHTGAGFLRFLFSTAASTSRDGCYRARRR